tara:strand:- start:98 stop:610 length:513 start_codon:yes stop_codon:yes gene_type:complete
MHYKIYGTDQIYNGKIVNIGDKLFTTVGGGYEGTSQEVQVATTTSTTNKTIRQTSKRGRRSKNKNQITSKFVRGDGSKFDKTYYLPVNYSGPHGSGGGPVKPKTPLHRHKNRRTMTEHSMGSNANSVVLTTTRPKSQAKRAVSRQRTKTTTQQRGTTRTTRREMGKRGGY